MPCSQTWPDGVLVSKRNFEENTKAASSLKGVKLDLLLEGIEINTSPTDYRPIKEMQVIKFQGESWQRIGNVVSGE